MLATSTFYPQHHYMPPRPSPLSERSANAAPRPFQFSMPTSMQSEPKFTAPQRAFKPNPIIQTRDAATKRRRDMFFKRVQKGRDDKKWDARGEQIQHLDHMSEQKRWEAEKACQAPQVHDDKIEEEMEELASLPEQEMEEADYVLAQEEREMQELIASMEEQDASPHYGSDDEDYDQLFMEYTDVSTLRQQHRWRQEFRQNASAGFEDIPDADAMDMS
ncbi:hypothetical protein PMIN02_004866 [Paraphaeosphaeria minitans]